MEARLGWVSRYSTVPDGRRLEGLNAQSASRETVLKFQGRFVKMLPAKNGFPFKSACKTPSQQGGWYAALPEINPCGMRTRMEWKITLEPESPGDQVMRVATTIRGADSTATFDDCESARSELSAWTITRESNVPTRQCPFA